MAESNSAIVDVPDQGVESIFARMAAAKPNKFDKCFHGLFEMAHHGVEFHFVVIIAELDGDCGTIPSSYQPEGKGDHQPVETPGR